MNDWDDLEFDFDVDKLFPKESEIIPQDFCFHEWKATLLIRSTVWDCTKCKVKKEDVK